MFRLFMTTVSFLCYTGAICQKTDDFFLSKLYLDSLIKSEDSTVKLEKGIYVINNSPYYDNQLDSILRLVQKRDLLDARLLKNKDSQWWGHNPDGWVVVVVTKHQQKKHTIKYYLKEANKVYISDTLSKYPDLYINDILIHKEFALQKVK